VGPGEGHVGQQALLRLPQHLRYPAGRRGQPLGHLPQLPPGPLQAGLGEDARVIAATSPQDDLGTRARAFLWKWTTQRRQEAPTNASSRARRNPWWASETTSLTARSPRDSRPGSVSEIVMS
jgi:hypothetical protein